MIFRIREYIARFLYLGKGQFFHFTYGILFFYSTFGNYLNSCTDLAERRGAMSGLWYGMPQEVRNTLSGIQYMWRGKPSDLGAGGGRDRTKRYHRGHLKPGDLSDRMRR